MNNLVTEAAVEEPTYLGNNSAYNQPFYGRLRNPTFLNTRIDAKDAKELTLQLCSVQY